MRLRLSALPLALIAAATFLTSFTLPARAQQAQPPRDEVTLRLAWIPGFGGDQLPFFLGQAMGFYRDVGIDLKIIEGKGAAPNAALLAQKSEQFSIIDGSVLALSVGQGLPIRSVGTLIQQAPFDIIFNTASGIKTLADLKGKTVGLQPGEAMTALFTTLLATNKIDPKSVKVVAITPANKPQVLYQGQVDAVGGYVTGDYYRVKLGAPAGMNIDQFTYPEYGISTVSASVATHVDLIKQNPGLVKRFMEATVRSWEYARKNPNEAVEFTLKAAPKANRVFLTDTLGWALKLAQTPRSAGKRMGWTAEADWVSTLDLLEKHVELKNRQPASAYFTNEFIPQ